MESTILEDFQDLLNKLSKELDAVTYGEGTNVFRVIGNIDGIVSDAQLFLKSRYCLGSFSEVGHEKMD